MKIIVSKTGEIHGRGSDPWKWVSRLTDEERRAVRENTAIVLVPDDNGHHMTTPFKRVKFYRGRYSHKNATPEEMSRWTGKKI